MVENQTTAPMCHACGGPCTGMCWKKKAVGAGLLLAVSGSLFLLALFASTLKEYQFIGRNVPGELTTISVSGDGEAYAAPDIATISFTITKESKTIAEARKDVDDKMKKIHEFLTKSGVKEGDIKANYSFYPKFEWHKTPCAYNYIAPPVGVVPPCNESGKQVLIGYEVSESVDVKIRDLDKNADAPGIIIGGLADNGATNLSGPNFMVEDDDTVKSKAREEAITKAKEKAEKLASDLGVKLVRITSFNEGGNYFGYNYASGAGMMKAMSADAGMPAPEAANIPAGENKFTSNVTITYEVR